MKPEDGKEEMIPVTMITQVTAVIEFLSLEYRRGMEPKWSPAQNLNGGNRVETLRRPSG